MHVCVLRYKASHFLRKGERTQLNFLLFLPFSYYFLIPILVYAFFCAQSLHDQVNSLTKISHKFRIMTLKEEQNISK